MLDTGFSCLGDMTDHHVHMIFWIYRCCLAIGQDTHYHYFDAVETAKSKAGRRAANGPSMIPYQGPREWVLWLHGFFFPTSPLEFA